MFADIVVTGVCTLLCLIVSRLHDGQHIQLVVRMVVGLGVCEAGRLHPSCLVCKRTRSALLHFLIVCMCVSGQGGHCCCGVSMHTHMGCVQ